jgi:DNA (cytosine-5)-methyltransferase 1
MPECDGDGSTDIKYAVDLFCGAGGLSAGLALACENLDRPIKVVAVNHWTKAIETHKQNHPDADHYNAKVEAVQPRAVVDGDVKILTGGPECTHFSGARGGKPVDEQKRASPWHVLDWVSKLMPEHVLLENVPEFCFPEDTMVLTEDGPVPIQEVEEGTKVLTHKNRWKEVTNTTQREGDTVSVTGRGNRLVSCTPNHEFYAKEIDTKCWGGKGGRHVQELNDPEWVAAEDLVPKTETTYEDKYNGYYWATPQSFGGDELEVPDVPSRVESSEPFWWMVGMWLGDGWFYKRNRPEPPYGLRIANKDLRVETRLEEVGELSWDCQVREKTDAYVFETSDKRLGQWMKKHFGECSTEKTIPAWTLALPEKYRIALIRGYQKADGSISGSDTRVTASTTSKKLAIGLKHLLESVGVSANLPAWKQHDDENLQDKFLITWDWTLQHEDNPSTKVYEEHRWTRVSETEADESGVTVYDLTVKDDHSYIADGVVAHNCSWGPVIDGQPTRNGKFFEAWITTFENLGYNVETESLVAADYGDPTSRERFFILASRDERPVWPKQTHSENGEIPGTEPRRPASEVIDWSNLGESIWKRNTPLVQNTMERIADGIRRHSSDVLADYADAIEQLGKADVEALQDNIVPAEEAAEVAENRDDPFLVRMEVPEVSADALDRDDIEVEEIDRTPFLLGQQSNAAPRDVTERAVPTIATRGAISLSVPSAFVLPRNGYHRGLHSNPAYDPDDRPMHTVTAQNHDGHLVSPYLVKYYGNSGSASVDDPLPTITTKARFGLCSPSLYPWGIDVRFRMLQPRELAAAMGFPDDYEFVGNKTETTEQIGNAVPVNLAQSLCSQLLDGGSPTLEDFSEGAPAQAQADGGAD